jgi:hypothetical protein
MAQTVNRRPFTAEGRVRSRISPCGICDERSGTGTSISPSTSAFAYQFDYTGAPLHRKMKETYHLHTGLRSKPQGCVASVASAAEPFTTNKNFPCYLTTPTKCIAVLYIILQLNITTLTCFDPLRAIFMECTPLR